MHLYLVQHGEAKREEDDPERGLTEKGFQDVGRVASFLARIPIVPVRIYHSGKTRARQTASILSDALGPSDGLHETGALAPTDDPETWCNRLAGMEGSLMLVGHLPHLSRLAGLLLEGDKGKGTVEFSMGGVVSLKRNESERWRVEWVVIPDIIVEQKLKIAAPGTD